MAKKTAKSTRSAQELTPVVLRIRKKDNTLYVRNLDEYPKTVQKKLLAIHEVPATKEAIAQAKTLLEQLGLAPAKKSEKSEKSEAPAKKQKKSTPPKFEPRTFELHGQTYVEAHPNKRNFNGMLFVLISEKEVTHSPKTGKKLKKPRTETVYQLVECMRVCTNTVWFLDHETEDAFPVRPEQVKERKIWEMDEDGNYTEEQKQNVLAELVPVVAVRKNNEQGE